VVEGNDGLYASAVSDDKEHAIIVKIVNSKNTNQQVEIALEGIAKISSSATMTVLKSENLESVNSLDDPKHVSPVEQRVELKGKKLNCLLSAESFTIIKISTR